MVGPAEDDRQRRGAHPAVPRRLDRGRAGRPVRPQHHRRALVQPPDARRPRGDGPQLRLARPQPPRSAYHEWVRGQEFAELAGERAGAGTSTPSTCPRADRHRRRGQRLRSAMDEFDGVNLFLSEGAGVQEIVAAMEAAGEEVAAGPVRPRPARQDQPRAVVRQAVRRAARRREGAGPEERLLLPLGRRERRRPRADQALHRLAVDAALRGEQGVVGRGRGARRRAARDRVRADRGRQGVRHVGAVVRRPPGGPRSAPSPWLGCTTSAGAAGVGHTVGHAAPADLLALCPHGRRARAVVGQPGDQQPVRRAGAPRCGPRATSSRLTWPVRRPTP